MTARHWCDSPTTKSETTPPVLPTQRFSALARHSSSLVVHFDVDAVDSRDLPLANYPHYGTGITLAAAGEVLNVLCANPGGFGNSEGSVGSNSSVGAADGRV